MKKTLKPICIILSAMLLFFNVTGCGNSSSSSGSNESITTSSQAISAVKNYMPGSALSLNQKIAGALGFKNFHDPQFGTSTATQNSDGSWDVNIKGNMSGYVDDYHDVFESYNFEVDATVSENGMVSISAKKAY